MFSKNEIVGNYRIIRPLGEGGMAAVYEVEHLKLGVHYALKTFTLQEGHVELFRKRFSVEGKILARLNHPNLVRVIDLDLDEKAGALYYVMDLVLSEDGETHTLADVKPGEADEAQVLGWFRQMCSALAYVHSQGIVHRDIKLNNILLAPDGRVVLSDFGISKVSDENLRSAVDVTKTMVTGMAQGRGVAMGTQGYMAPEVCRGEEATPAADVYSLGVAFFRLLTNVWYDPCLAPSADSGDVIAMNSVKLLEPFEYQWADVLPVMLDENPQKRPLNLIELPDRIAPVAQPETPKRFGAKWKALIAAVVVIALGVGCWLYWGQSPQTQGQSPQTIRTDDLLAIPAAAPEG